MCEDKDFRLKVTRDELEEMSKDIFERIEQPITSALKMSGLTMVSLLMFQFLEQFSLTDTIIVSIVVPELISYKKTVSQKIMKINRLIHPLCARVQ